MSSTREDEAQENVKSSAPPRTAHAYPSYVHPEVLDAQANDVFWILVALRIANALTIGTFFQPDEYYQSLEPAWATVFGRESGAWITWEWPVQLRSSLHPLLFAIVYYLSSVLSFVIDLSPPLRAELLVAAPKVVQGVLAALTDFYTWKLNEKLYSRGSSVAWAALSLTVLSPWQWFFSTRTFSNNLETTLTIVAMYLWPWHWSSDKLENDVIDQHGLRASQKKSGKRRPLDELTKLRRALLLAACACFIRQTDALIWLCVGAFTLRKATARETTALLRESAICGSVVVVLEGLVDRWFYGTWIFPPFRFLYYNIAQNIAVFYGTSRLDYYYTEGLPLVLTTALPFAIVGVWQGLRFRSEGLPANLPGSEASAAKVSQGALRIFAIIVCILPMSLSFLSHKEVRFINPILPLLHVLAAKPFASFYDPFPVPKIGWRKLLLFTTIFVNLLIAGYAGYVHQRGVMNVTQLLRREHQQVLYDLAVAGETNATRSYNMSVGFLMPCHSTPWRSHLVHPTIEAWALTCEPPLDIPLPQRHRYTDEADQFYENPERWLDIHMAPLDSTYDKSRNVPTGQAHRRKWPDYLVFFEQLEPDMQRLDVARHYSEYWRGFNTHWHDDWRRQGDVIAWRRGKGKDA
ncbi:glycosyltransferase family 22 protein [Viridothelium virens]|uniref:Mannosyltransferase n=1 Tax=Viridothelium virens TaxID=1048519 RepID=A0A6A6HMM6_VIRVR|nr:glycosyltransferase family 22 protein [Viridothelium virens]